MPRFLLGAPASGSGKTLITCGILQALQARGKAVASFKCGPDYIFRLPVHALSEQRQPLHRKFPALSDK